MPTNALHSITIQGFESIASIKKLELGPVNVVVGPNGSGKSNFLGAFDFLHYICDGWLQRYVVGAGGAEKVLHFGWKNTKQIELHLAFQPVETWPCGELGYELILSPSTDDGLFPSGEAIFHDGYPTPLSPRAQGREAGISDPKPEFDAKFVRDHLVKWRLYHLNDTSLSSPLRGTANVDDNRFLRADSANLSAFLYLLREKYEDSYNSIVRVVQRVAPFFDNFQLEPRGLDSRDIRLEWRHKNSDQYFDVSSLSDGTLRFIALTTLFLQPERFRPSVILIDEPELGLHPFALEVLAALVRQASVATQVILSTQSSLFLDHFEPKDVLVAELVDNGTQMKRLEPDRLAKWLDDYSLGQLWEKNEIGGRPVPG
jgi:predicted ATPase